MTASLQITFKNMDPDDTLQGAIQRRAAKLERAIDRLQTLRVAVEAPATRGDRCFRVRLQLALPARCIVAGGRSRRDRANVYAAIREAFSAAEREVDSYLGRRRAHRRRTSIRSGYPARQSA
jgi:ribosome-associated translation inhibitor RaiA